MFIVHLIVPRIHYHIQYACKQNHQKLKSINKNNIDTDHHTCVVDHVL